MSPNMCKLCTRSIHPFRKGESWLHFAKRGNSPPLVKGGWGDFVHTGHMIELNCYWQPRPLRRNGGHPAIPRLGAIEYLLSLFHRRVFVDDVA